MKSLKIFLWIFLLWLLQTVFPEFIRINGVLPQLLYIFVICIAFNEKKMECYVAVSVIAGLLAELTFGVSSGFYLSCYVITALLVILLGNIFYKELFLFIAMVTLVLTFSSTSIYYILNKSLFVGMTYKSALINVILPTMIYNSIISVLMNKLIKMTIYKNRR